MRARGLGRALPVLLLPFLAPDSAGGQMVTPPATADLPSGATEAAPMDGPSARGRAGPTRAATRQHRIRDLASPLPTGLAGNRAPPREQEQSRREDRVSPLGAFLRNLAVPGWGHAAVGAYNRGGFYFFADAAIAWMIFKTVDRLHSADEMAALREADARRRLRAQGITDPDSLETAVEEDEAVAAARGLADARTQQREDWIAVGVFFWLLGGADAFVSAHLADIPPPLGIRPGPGRSVEVRAELPIRLFGGPSPPRRDRPRGR